MIPYTSCRNTRVQILQYKIINYIINCREKLHNWKITEDNICKKCALNTVDDIIHFFYLCPKVKLFWNCWLNWWNNINILVIDKKGINIVEHLIFGFINGGENFKVLNYPILYAKMYIPYNPY